MIMIINVIDNNNIDWSANSPNWQNQAWAGINATLKWLNILYIVIQRSDLYITKTLSY